MVPQAGFREGRDNALALRERMGLADRAARYPSELSGDRQQRVAIAALSPWTRWPCGSASPPRPWIR